MCVIGDLLGYCLRRCHAPSFVGRGTAFDGPSSGLLLALDSAISNFHDLHIEASYPLPVKGPWKGMPELFAVARGVVEVMGTMFTASRDRRRGVKP
jgi:hypothetical protein